VGPTLLCLVRSLTVLMSRQHSPWVDMYYRRPKQELRPLVNAFLGQCEDAEGFICKALGGHTSGAKFNSNIDIIDTVYDGLKQADRDMAQKRNRVRSWLTDQSTDSSLKTPSGGFTAPVYELLHSAPSQVWPPSVGFLKRYLHNSFRDCLHFLHSRAMHWTKSRAVEFRQLQGREQPPCRDY